MDKTKDKLPTLSISEYEIDNTFSHRAQGYIHRQYQGANTSVDIIRM
jgi:hypothetical protein